MTDKFTETIEQITARKVIAFLSQVHFNPDLATETFILDPSDEDKAATLSTEH
jgi:hypothetical protein